MNGMLIFLPKVAFVLGLNFQVLLLLKGTDSSYFQLKFKIFVSCCLTNFQFQSIHENMQIKSNFLKSAPAFF